MTVKQPGSHISRVLPFVLVLQVFIALALGSFASFARVLGITSEEFLLPSVVVAVVALVVVAADVRAIAPKPQVSTSEIGIVILSVVVGIMLLWLALIMFEVGYFTPFILGLGGRGLDHIHALTLSSEGSVGADRDFVQVFGGYLLVAGFASVPLGGGAGLIGYVSRRVHRSES